MSSGMNSGMSGGAREAKDGARSGFDDLYQEIILDHNRHPRNFGALPEPDRKVEGYNPLCGDRVTVFLKLGRPEGGAERIEDIAFEGSGCAISTASASLMTEALKGRTVAEAEELFQKVHALLAGREPAAGSASADPGDPFGEVGKLAALAGVRNYPMRVKCATLAWHALHSALSPAAAGAASPEA
jgi:nitrogen fixation NifU-like protein